MEPISTVDRLQALPPTILRILSLSGTAGAAIGVLHHGKVVHTAGYGFRDAQHQLPMDEETVVSLFSLTKAMTASAIGNLVDSEKTSWDEKVVHAFPGFWRENETVLDKTTIRYLLTHRAGLGQYNSLWVQDFGRLYLGKQQTVFTAEKLPVTAEFRKKFQYNN